MFPSSSSLPFILFVPPADNTNVSVVSSIQYVTPASYDGKSEAMPPSSFSPYIIEQVVSSAQEFSGIPALKANDSKCKTRPACLEAEALEL